MSEKVAPRVYQRLKETIQKRMGAKGTEGSIGRTIYDFFRRYQPSVYIEKEWQIEE